MFCLLLFFFLNEFSFRCKPYYNRFQLSVNWRYYSITSRKRRFNSPILEKNAGERTFNRVLEDVRPQTLERGKCRNFPVTNNFFELVFFFFNGACVILGTVLHSYLYATSYIANVLGLRSLQEEASSFFFLQSSKGQNDWGGRFSWNTRPSCSSCFTERAC